VSDRRGEILAEAVTGPVPRRDVVVNTGELSLHCVIWGDDADPPVLLIHGNGAHAHWWDTLVPALTRDHRLLAVDLRGHGSSEWPAEIAYRLADYERDLVELLDALAEGPVPIIAHSMGGRAALWLAAHQPARVAGVAVVDSSLGEVGGPEVEAFREKVRERRMGGPYASYASAMATYRLVPDEPGVPEEVLRDVAHHAITEREPGDWRVCFDRGVLLGDGEGNMWDLIAKLQCPLRVAYAQGAGIEQLGVIELLEHFPEVPTRLFPGGHHFLLAHSEPLGSWLREFLREVTPGS
jgi:pimeloyl-ACP methyl ester carboxylesterase